MRSLTWQALLIIYRFLEPLWLVNIPFKRANFPMPNIKSAKKRMRQNVKHRMKNRAERSTLRTFVKKLRTAIEEGDQATAQTLLPETISVLDRSAKKGLIHKNKAARHTSELTKKVKAMGSSS